MLTHFSLFSGIGGIDLAAEWAGFETVGQCEYADYPTKVLEKHWPKVPRWRDISNVSAEEFKQRTGIKNLTLISAGFPCQPHSTSGKRKGSGDERDMWGELRRVIGEIKPRWFLGENVRGLLSSEDGRFLGKILSDLALMGYNVGWCCYGADRVGAIHQRKRVFIVAYADGKRCICMEKELQDKCPIFDISTLQEWRSDTHDLFNALERDFSKPISGVHRNDDGIPEGLDRLKCLGNAVVPQQVYPVLKAISEIERNSKGDN